MCSEPLLHLFHRYRCQRSARRAGLQVGRHIQLELGNSIPVIVVLPFRIAGVVVAERSTTSTKSLSLGSLSWCTQYRISRWSTHEGIGVSAVYATGGRISATMTSTVGIARQTATSTRERRTHARVMARAAGQTAARQRSQLRAQWPSTDRAATTSAASSAVRSSSLRLGQLVSGERAVV